MQHMLIVIRAKHPKVLSGTPQAIRTRFEVLRAAMINRKSYAPIAIWRYGARNQLLDSFMLKNTRAFRFIE